MSSTLTIRHLAEPVKQKLRIRAARHGRSMEAEAREILSRAVTADSSVANEEPSPQERMRKAVDALTGIWAGRGTTEELMRLTRGDD